MAALATVLLALGFTKHLAWTLVLAGVGCLFLTYRWISQRTENQKLTEEVGHLQRWKDQSNLILHSMGEGMFGVDLEGKVTFVNAAALRMLGWDADDFIGQLIENVLLKQDNSSADGQQPTSGRARVNEHFGVEVMDEQFRRRNGSSFPVAYTCSPIVDQNNNIAGALYIFRDDTARKRYESELQQYSEEMQSINRELEAARAHADKANNAKSSFLANMSHEIRTPLNGVIGVTSLLERTELNDKQRKHVDRIKQSGQILMGIINDILDYSRIEARELTLEAIPTDLYQLVHDIADMLNVVADEKHLPLRIVIKAGTPQQVLTDPLRLRQVLSNLINNAIKFTSQGQVTVTLSPVNTDATDGSPPRVRFEIQDTGIGIPQEKHAQLFQKFYQADASTTRKFGGTGLGLAICKQLVELMEGSIGLESQEDVGSTFWFELPLHQEATIK